jgi:hypothetical protein
MIQIRNVYTVCQALMMVLGFLYHVIVGLFHAAIVSRSSPLSLSISTISRSSGRNWRSSIVMLCSRWSPSKDRSRDSWTWLEQYVIGGAARGQQEGLQYSRVSNRY